VRPVFRQWCVAAIGALALIGTLKVATAQIVRAASVDVGGDARDRRARHWSVNDIVEVKRIIGTAVFGNARTAAFILKEPSLSAGRNLYSLFQIDSLDIGRPRKLLDAPFIADLSWHPGSLRWTVRMDVGRGVQLYDVDAIGSLHEIVMNPEVVDVGGSNGMILSSSEEIRSTGVISYEWSPSGERLWYSALRRKSEDEQRSELDQGTFYDDKAMARWNLSWSSVISKLELRLRTIATNTDLIIAEVLPSDPIVYQQLFKAKLSAAWLDERRVRFRSAEVQSDQTLKYLFRTIDTKTGFHVDSDAKSPADAYGYVPVTNEYLAIRRSSDGTFLTMIGDDGKERVTYPSLRIASIGQTYARIPHQGSDTVIFDAQYGDHFVPVSFSRSTGPQLLANDGATYSNCSFSQDLQVGVCSRESLTRAPDLILITAGVARTLFRPNSSYDAILPLRTERAYWKNRYGATSNGYITYPRSFTPGRKRPAILVSHGQDAVNRFAAATFQWEFPVQAFAEEGYFVISVNEPEMSMRVREVFGTGVKSESVTAMQAAIGFNAVATMEAAASEAVAARLVDANQIGIAGYSRGGSVATLALSHSRLFQAGSSGDTDFYSAGTYWASAGTARTYNTIFGGSPLNPEWFPNYLAFSPSARPRQFSGPLLQQFTEDGAAGGFELFQALRQAGIPTELIFYQDESHIFHQPRHRASAMQLNLAWFNYWLLGRRDPDQEKIDLYSRWDKMARKWHDTQNEGAAR
jgi:dipeptidyl aminopeptidase/acylaminoacyl peptidase